jgi:SOS response regulatory protein OraA/RecX
MGDAEGEIGGDGGSAPSPDRTAAERLLAKHRRSLERVADPRQRRQRAYALLARNGFDPETCREVAATVDITEEQAEPLD